MGYELVQFPPPTVMDVAEENLVPAETVSDEAPPDSTFRRKKSGGGGWTVSLIISLVAHCGFLGLGFYAVRHSMGRYEAPQLILPKGWATDFDGTGNAGASFGNVQPVIISAPAAGAAEKSVANPFEKYEPADVTPPAVTIDASQGTEAASALPTLGGSVSAPANLRRPPVGSSGGEEVMVASAGSSGATPAEESNQGAGSAASGAGDGSGGGTQGVPEGLPVPSIRNKIPPYPAQALRNRWTGTVLLQLTIDASGEVSAARILKSSNYDVLDRSALETARTWQFTPARLNGRAIALTVARPVNFEQSR